MLDTLPDSLILQILYRLTPTDVVRAGQCCKTLRNVAHDNILWRHLFHQYFRVTPFFREPIGPYDSWRSEFIRLVDETAVVEVEVLKEHTDQVLHVSFSHDGQRFATTAKDAFIHIWKSTHPVSLELSYSMKKFSWKYTQFSQFNESDTLLLVSGVLFGLQSTCGEIAVFGVNDGFQLRCRVPNKPYDTFGTWFSDKFLLSGDLKWLGNLISKSVIWINKASQETESEHLAVMNHIYQFYNRKASSIRSLLVANCVDTPSCSEQSLLDGSKTSGCGTSVDESLQCKYDRVGNPPSHYVLPLERDLMRINSRGMRGTLQGAFQNWKAIDNVSDIDYTAEFHNEVSREREREKPGISTVQDSEELPCSSKDLHKNATTFEDRRSQKRLKHLFERLSPSRDQNSSGSELVSPGSSIGTSSKNTPENEELSPFPPRKRKVKFTIGEKSTEDESGSESDAEGSTSTQEPPSQEPCYSLPQRFDEDKIIDPREKWLIFTCGTETYTPHQIGFKRIVQFKFNGVLERGPSIRDRLEEFRRRKALEDNGQAEEVDYSDFAKVADRFDTTDFIIDLHGHIIGMTLSPDHRYLYVNSRPWPAGYTISDPLTPPPIAQEIDIHVIDLMTLKQVGMMRRAHRAYTPNEECFFIFLDASDYYLASGAEDKFGYLWDRHYGISLTKLPHTDVVNAVAFNPVESEMLVSVSDDHTIKVWRSKRQCRALGIDQTNLVQGTKLYLKSRPSCLPGPSNSI